MKFIVVVLLLTLVTTDGLKVARLGRRAAAAGLIASGLAGSARAASPDECLACKLKSSIAGGGMSIRIGDDVGAMLSSNSKPLAVVDVVEVGRDPSKFDRAMASTLAKHDPTKERVLVWVQSELIDGVPWCPDTRAALPLLEQALYRASGAPIVLVVADVARREYMDASFAYRQSPQLKLAGVPTLYRWGRKGPVIRLQEQQITPAALDALITMSV